MNDVLDEPERCFRALHAAHARALLSYALRRVDQPADAADVVAETFLVAWRRLADVPPGSSARPWLFGVARKVLANQRRGDLRRSKLADRFRSDLARQVTVDPASEATTAEVVRRAMTALTADERELLWLTAWEGLSPAEIAVAFDLAPPTARTRLHRARARLRAQLADLGWDGERCGPAGHVEDDGQALVQELGSDG